MYCRGIYLHILKSRNDIICNYLNLLEKTSIAGKGYIEEATVSSQT